MNNLEVILESIISEGKTESQNILDDANDKAQRILSDKKSEADKKAVSYTHLTLPTSDLV